jgi:hypothetical protein
VTGDLSNPNVSSDALHHIDEPMLTLEDIVAYERGGGDESIAFSSLTAMG